MPNKNDSYIKSSKGGKNVNFMRQLYERENAMITGDNDGDDDGDDDDDDDEDEKKVKSELRQTTKNNKRFHSTYLKKKEVIIKEFPILSQKTAI